MIENFEISSEIENLVKIESVIDTLSKRLGISDEVYGNILISTVEAVNNAIVHGNKYNREKKVRITIKADGNCFEVIVNDEGEGFNSGGLPDPTTAENIEKLNGRGVFIMRKLCDEIEFNEKGNEVKMKFKY